MKDYSHLYACALIDKIWLEIFFVQIYSCSMDLIKECFFYIVSFSLKYSRLIIFPCFSPEIL